MAVCSATNCSKREQCTKYIGNYNSNKVEQVIDWSTHGYGSIGIDGNGNTYFKEHYNCGDLSDGYPMFSPKELDPKCEWIPCSFCNPEENGKYLVTCEGIDIPQIRLYEGDWDSTQRVVAWRDLPEIYLDN